MDLETENRIAAILLKEAAELRRQADRDGVGVYLQKPNVRGRPNSRFLTATVLGVQQANRAVEVNEMWRVRQRELELNDRLKKRSKDVSGSGRNHRDVDNSARSTSKRHDDNASTSYISSKRVMENCYSRKDEGLRDEEVEEFLHSRIKRGRGSVGSRMDETGPYLPTGSDSPRRLSPTPVAREQRVMLGPEKPSSLMFHDSSSDEELPKKPSSWKSHSHEPSSSDEELPKKPSSWKSHSHEPSSSDEELHKYRNKKRKKVHSSSDKKRSRKHNLKEKSRDKKKKRKEERRK